MEQAQTALAGVFDGDALCQQFVHQLAPGAAVETQPLRAQVRMRKHRDARCRGHSGGDLIDSLARQRLLHARVHAQSGKGRGSSVQRIGRVAQSVAQRLLILLRHALAFGAQLQQVCNGLQRNQDQKLLARLQQRRAVLQQRGVGGVCLLYTSRCV